MQKKEVYFIEKENTMYINDYRIARNIAHRM